MTSSSSSAPVPVAGRANRPLDVALLKSWDFSGWERDHGAGRLPYRMDHLERCGIRLHWTDRLHREAWRSSRPASIVRVGEAASVPFSQALLMAGEIRRSPAVLAMFESEANFLAAARRFVPAGRRSVFAVISCWLAEILETSTHRRRSGYRWAYRSVDRLYYLSANQGPILEEHLRMAPDRLRYLPFGVDTETYAPTGDRDRGYVLAVGRDKGRDWPNLFRAVEQLDLPVKICCRLSDISELRVPANVEVLGYVDRHLYRDLLAQARVVVVATRPVLYPSGQSVLLEAMASGRTVVVTGTPALEGYVHDDVDCLVVPPMDPDALREGIVNAAGDDSLRLRIGIAARQAAVSNHSASGMWATVASDLIEMHGGR